jgi:CHAT domain-containing protein/Tfp pilus assembly protein PilF
MLWLKEFFVSVLFLTTALFSFLGITNSSHSFNPNPDFNSSKNSFNDLVVKPSDEFNYYLDLIQNKPIDKNELQDELTSLESKFEREFLSALLKKREGEFEKAFKQLIPLLYDIPDHFNYYEELALLGKISGNSRKLSEWLEKNKSNASNKFYFYLKALVELQSGKTTQAIETFQSLVSDGFTSKEIYFQLASAYRITGNYDASFNNLISAESLCNKDDPFIPKIINLKGTIFYLSGDYEHAKKNYTSALDFSIKSGNKAEEIKSFANLAIIKDVYGDIFEARDDFQRAIKMAEEIENVELLAFLYSELGVSFSYTASLIDSRKNYEKSFLLYEKLENNERLSYLSSNIGSLYLQIANYKSALDYYSSGLKFAGENKLGQILNLTGLADVYSNESNYSKALQYYNRAKEIADSIKDISSSVKIDQGIGALYYNINFPYKALEILKEADSYLADAQLPYEQIKLYSKIGTVLTSVDSLASAEEHYQKALDIASNVGDIYSSIVLKTELGYLRFRQGDYERAVKLITDAQIVSKTYELNQLIGLQELYLGKIFQAQNKKELVIFKFENAFQLSGTASDYINQVEAAYTLGLIYDENSDMVQAEGWYLTAIEMIEKISFPLSLNQEIQIAHFSGMNSVYNSLAELNLKQGKSEEAFKIIDKSRSRNTKSNLARLKLLSNLDVEQKYNRLIDLEWMINSGLYDKTTLDSLSRLHSEIKSELTSRSGSLAEILNPDNELDLKKLQSKLGQNDYLISAYAGKNLFSVFRISSDEFVHKNIPIGRDSLLQLITQVSPIYRSNLESEEIYVNEDLFSFNAQSAYKFYDVLFKDILSDIPKESNLIVSLPVELVKLPLEMLVTEWTEGESPYYYNDKEFLLEKFNISYTPSVSIYELQSGTTESTAKQNLLIGDPFIDNAEFALSIRSGLVDLNPSQARNILLFPLKYSRSELESIDKTISESQMFILKDATESNFKQQAPLSNVIHISTHSFLLKDQPLILFSPKENDDDDGFLELGEIIQLNLNSDLVVLSSCRSGLGRIDAAEGIIGMQKAFIDAGSRSVLVSLWDVNDKYTSYFMKSFYEHLAEDNSKSEALRLAKLDFIKNYSANPYYWSAFVLSGNISAVEINKASSIGMIQIILAAILLIGVYYLIQRLRTRNKNS